MNNEIRRAIVPVIARSEAPARLTRPSGWRPPRSSPAGVARRCCPCCEPRATGRPTPTVKDALSLGLARSDLRSPDSARKRQALEVLQALGTGEVKGEIEALLRKTGDRFAEPDPQVRKAAEAALASIRNRERLTNAVGHIVYGLWLASVFLFAALGLAITFGVMGVINMAHGEMLTIGAYTTYVVQVLFQKTLPGRCLPSTRCCAIPVAFVAAGGDGHAARADA